MDTPDPRTNPAFGKFLEELLDTEKNADMNELSEGEASSWIPVYEAMQANPLLPGMLMGMYPHMRAMVN